MKCIEWITSHNMLTDNGIFVHRVAFPFLHLMHIVASGCSVRYLNTPPPPAIRKHPCIYVANHSNCHDMPVMARVINSPFFVLASNEPKGEFAGLGLWINGVIWSDRRNRTQRVMAKQRCIDCLKKGCDLLIFPEGTWNITHASPMLPISWGVIEISQRTGVPIIPVALEYDGKRCTINVGESYFPASGEDKKFLCDELRDKMASLRWECWERNGMFQHKEVTWEDYEKYSSERIAEYGLLTEEELSSWVLRKESTSEQVFSCLKDIAISKNNAFLLKKYR